MSFGADDPPYWPYTQPFYSTYQPFVITTSTDTIFNCPYCGSQHTGTCPRIKRIEYFENGTIRAVEFHPGTTVVVGEGGVGGYAGG